MSDRSAIEWTDASWNPIRARHKATGKIGWHCVHHSPGCINCYAETFNKRLGTGLGYRAQDTASVEIFIDDKALAAPLHWRRPRRVFVCSMTDLFADFMTDAMIDRVFAVMALSPQHTFQVLTKRDKRMREYLIKRNGMGNADLCRAINAISAELGNRHGALEMPLPNLWLGVSVEDQARADERIPDLLATPAAIRFLSCEPLLGPLNLWLYLDPLRQFRRRLNWVIVGGESGPNARPMHPHWARALHDQCAAAGVPFFFKQWGEFLPGERIGKFGEGRVLFPDGEIFAVVSDGHDILLAHADDHRGAPQKIWRAFWASGDGRLLKRVGKKAAGALLDGKEHREFPR